MPLQRYIVIDGNLPWVRSLFLAMPPDRAEAYFIRIFNLKYLFTTRAAWRHIFAWNRVASNAWEKYVFVPGWTKFARLSKWLTLRACSGLSKERTTRPVTFFTMPHYRDLPDEFPGSFKLYYVHDTLGTYGWNFEPIIAWERKLVSKCDAVLTVSKQLAIDFRKRTKRPVKHSPNAVGEEFVREMIDASLEPSPSMPRDIAAIPRPIVGCTGHINHSYDWKLIGELAEALPEVSFVFIGPRTTASAETRNRISQVLERKNVFWLGPKPHSELHHFLASFDVCFNPLAINYDNDRRCPLRLFDYMATDKPILSTPVAEAFLHQDYMTLTNNEQDAAQFIREMVAGARVPKLDARREYVRRHTWTARARDLLDFVREQLETQCYAETAEMRLSENRSE